MFFFRNQPNQGFQQYPYQGPPRQSPQFGYGNYMQMQNRQPYPQIPMNRHQMQQRMPINPMLPQNSPPNQMQNQMPVQMPPQLPQQMPQQMPQQAPQQMLPQMPNQQPAPFQAGQNQTYAAPPNENENLKNLKNVGTFMGYPEYTLPDADKQIVPPLDSKSGDSDMLKDFCQNERNGYDFYSHLASLAHSDSGRSSLLGIADRANSRSNRIKNMLNNFSEGYSPESRNIKRDIGYEEGLRLAVKEESRFLSKCASFYESTGDRILKEHMNNLIIEKLCQINEISRLMD